jgi:hypothetical protein
MNRRKKIMAKLKYPASMPYDEVNIYDNSVYSDYDTAVALDDIPDGPIAFIPFVSEKGLGEDNKLVYLNSSTIARYGDPNMDKYGISLYLANQYIAGGGSVLGMRLKPDDATVANRGVVALVRIADGVPYTVTAKSNNNGMIVNTTYPQYSHCLTDIQELVDGDTFNDFKAIGGMTILTNSTYTINNIKYEDTTYQIIDEATILKDDNGRNVYKINDKGEVIAAQKVLRTYYDTSDEVIITEIVDVNDITDTAVLDAINKGEKYIVINGQDSDEAKGIANAKKKVASAEKVIAGDGETVSEGLSEGTLEDLNDVDDLDADEEEVVETTTTSTDLTSVSAFAYKMVVEPLVLYEPIVRSVMYVRHKLVSIKNATSPDILKTAFDNWGDFDVCNNDDKIAESILGPYGYKPPRDCELVSGRTYVYPLFIIYDKATGSNGNEKSFKLSSDNITDNETIRYEKNGRFYKLRPYESGSSINEVVSFSLNDFVYSTESMNCEEVFETYSTYMSIYQSSKYDIFKDTVKKYIIDAADGTSLTDEEDVEDVDILFGIRKGTQYKYSRYVIDSASDDLSTAKGIYLMNGSYGSFENVEDELSEDKTEIVTYKEDILEERFNEQFVKAYSGEIDELIFDDVRCPFLHVFAPTTNKDVINAIHDLIETRYTTFAHYNLEAANTYADSIVYINQSKYNQLRGWKEAFYAETAMIKDIYTGKRIRMPASYFNSYEFAQNAVSNKCGKPFAGDRYTWRGFIKNTLQPQTVDQQTYIDCHEAGFNVMIEDGYGSANPLEQITAQATIPTVSALSEINNAMILLQMVYIALKTAKTNRWVELDDDEIDTYRSTLESAIDTQLGSLYNTCTITAERESVNGAGQNRIHCVITVNFKSLLKGVTYDFYVV